MAVWDIIGVPLENSEATKSGINSSYSSIIGDSLAFVIGGGRATNIYGGDCKMVLDWEKLVEMLFDGIPDFMGKELLGGLIFGLGGDTSVVFGDKNAFTYEGTDFTSKRARDKLEVTTKELGIPLPLTLALGSMGLLAAALVLRFKYGIYNSSQKTSNTWNEDTQGKSLDLVMTLLVLLQPRWLKLMQTLEQFFYIVDPTAKAALQTTVTALKSTLDTAEADLKLLEAQLAAEEARVAAIVPPQPTLPNTLNSLQAAVATKQAEVSYAWRAYYLSFDYIKLSFGSDKAP